MTDDIISYAEYQKLSDEEKQNFEPHWLDGKSGIATRKGTKIPEAKSTIPVDEMKAGPSTSHTTATEKDTDAGDKGKTETTDKTDLMRSLKVKTNRIRNYLTDKTDTTINPFQNGKTETTDKANQMSLKVKTDTTATDKSINPFQAGKEAADKAVEDTSILSDRVKQLGAKIDSLSSRKRNTFSPIDPDFDKELLEIKKETEALAKEFGIDVGSLSTMKRVSNPMAPAPSKSSQLEEFKEINKKLEKAVEERSAAAKAWKRS